MNEDEPNEPEERSSDQPDDGESDDDASSGRGEEPETESGAESSSDSSGESASEEGSSASDPGAPPIDSGEGGNDSESNSDSQQPGEPSSSGGSEPGQGGAGGSAPGGGVAPGAGETRDAADKLADQLDSEQPLAEQDLIDMGFSPERAKAFLDALRRLHDARARDRFASGEAERRSHDVKLGSGVVEEGTSRAADAGAADAAVDTTDDQLDHGGRGSAASVPPHLRRILDQYYRALARSRSVAASQPAAKQP